MYRQSGQGQVWLQPNSVGIDSRRGGTVNSSQQAYGELGTVELVAGRDRTVNSSQRVYGELGTVELVELVEPESAVVGEGGRSLP